MQFKATVKYGHAEINTWFQPDPKTGRMIGMGKVTEYDRNGIRISEKIEPTGVVVGF